MDTQQDQIIHSFAVRQNEKIQIKVRNYEGKFFVDIRLWFQTKKDPTFYPTKKGISFPLFCLKELHQGVERLVAVSHKFENTEQEEICS